jgi:hypothetical protein
MSATTLPPQCYKRKESKNKRKEREGAKPRARMFDFFFVYSEKLRPRPAGGRGGSSSTTQTRKTFSVRTKTRSSVSSGTSFKRRLFDSLRYNAACEHAMLLPEWPTRPTTPWKSRGMKTVTCAYDSYILIRNTPFSSQRRCRRAGRKENQVSEPWKDKKGFVEPHGRVYTQSWHT